MVSHGEFYNLIIVIHLVIIAIITINLHGPDSPRGATLLRALGWSGMGLRLVQLARCFSMGDGSWEWNHPGGFLMIERCRFLPVFHRLPSYVPDIFASF